MYKKNCGFRKINLCGFKKEHCNKDECDMHSVNFSAKSILKQSKQEQKAIEDLNMKMVEEKNKNGKTDKYKKLKNDRNDKVIGMMKLAKAYEHCKRTKK